MFTRQLIAAAAMMVATCAANADVLTTANVSSDMSIVDTSTSLSGADTGLAAMLASTNTSSQLVLVRGVEGLYMLASRANAPAQTAADQATLPADGATDVSLPVTNADAPVVTAADVPEPATLTLMLAGVLGAIGFTRARKQG